MSPHEGGCIGICFFGFIFTLPRYFFRRAFQSREKNGRRSDSLFSVLKSPPFSRWIKDPGMTTTPFLEESQIPQKGLNGSFWDAFQKPKLAFSPSHALRAGK